MKLSPLTIGDLTAPLPIVQGGMGIGVSGACLASAVANAGGIGIISGVQIGYREADFYKSPFKANLRALRQEIKKAREKSPTGILGVNFMVAMTHYKEMVQAAVEEKIDLIVSGAGLPLDLPSLVGQANTKLVPIVSSAKAANIIIKRWKRQGRKPDALVVEGPQAGGHLGFKKEEIDQPAHSLDQLVTDLVALLKKLGEDIPIIAAGGIDGGGRISELLRKGASGVQLGSLFVPTHECDAAPAFKEAYLKASPEDIGLIHSPVGLPGRAIHNDFVDTITDQRLPVKRCFNCLENCNPKTTPYCISQALIDAVSGQEGLIFTGAKGGQSSQLRSVKAVIDQLVQEAKDS